MSKETDINPNPPSRGAPGSVRTARNLEWAGRELMKMHDEETDPQLRALWSTAARIARERIAVNVVRTEMLTIGGTPPNDRGQARLDNPKA